MSAEIPVNKTEKKEVSDDNARKFLVGAIDNQFLSENSTSSFTLIVDWLQTGEDNETKVAYKKFDNGDTQILLISKITKNGSRTSEKEEITEESYEEHLLSSILHLEKKRHEFIYNQNGIAFSVKYDIFADGELYMLEVDAPNEDERDSFDLNDFPGEMTEVTGDIHYYGYHVANIV